MERDLHCGIKAGLCSTGYPVVKVLLHRFWQKICHCTYRLYLCCQIFVRKPLVIIRFFYIRLEIHLFFWWSAQLMALGS